jgi:hypothetical protein
MNKYSFSSFLSPTLAVAAFLAAGYVPSTQAQTCPPKPTKLQFAMGSLGGDLRPLAQNLSNPEQINQNIFLVNRMRIYAAASKLEVPPKAERLSGPAREEFLAAYEAKMTELEASLSEILLALQSQNLPAAQAGLQKIIQLRKDGHLEFQE